MAGGDGWTASALEREGLGDRRSLARMLKALDPVARGPQGEARYALRQMRACKGGTKLENLVDRTRGY